MKESVPIVAIWAEPGWGSATAVPVMRDRTAIERYGWCWVEIQCRYPGKVSEVWGGTSWRNMRWGWASLIIVGSPPWSLRRLTLRLSTVRREAGASPSFLLRVAIRNVLGS